MIERETAQNLFANSFILCDLNKSDFSGGFFLHQYALFIRLELILITHFVLMQWLRPMVNASNCFDVLRSRLFESIFFKMVSNLCQMPSGAISIACLLGRNSIIFFFRYLPNKSINSISLFIFT